MRASTPTHRTRLAAAIVAFGLVTLACAAPATSGRPGDGSEKHVQSSVPSLNAGVDPAVLPADLRGAPLFAGPETVTSTAGSGGAGTSGSSGVTAVGVSVPAIYPAYGGTTALAAEKTIVATASGTAQMKTDGSDRAAAEQKAVSAAYAEAKRQATLLATSMGVQIDHVYAASVSVSSDDLATSKCVAPEPAANIASGGPAMPKCAVQTPATRQAYASTTVAFAFR